MTPTVETADFTSLHAAQDVKIPLALTALSPISHGAGSKGNTQLLRTHDVLDPDHNVTAAPYVSGSSIRHSLRAELGWHLVRALELPGQSLPKPVVDLLWSGGAISTTGSQADLSQIRRVHQLIPGLGLLGYSAKSDIVAGTLWVRHAELVCWENSTRLPGRLADHPLASRGSGGLRTEDFSTRRDVVGTPVDRFIAAAEGELWDSTQMIWDTQYIGIGSVLYTTVELSTPTLGHTAALATALDLAAPLEDGMRVLHLGGKRASGHGACAVDSPELDSCDLASWRARYDDHLAAHREEILALLSEVTG